MVADSQSHLLVIWITFPGDSYSTLTGRCPDPSIANLRALLCVSLSCTEMASSLCLSPIPHLGSGRRRPSLRREHPRESRDIRRYGRNPSSPGGGDAGPPSESAVLKLAWYGSELLGIAASFFRPAPSPSPAAEHDGDGEVLGLTSRAQVVEAIKQDFQRSYFVTGNLTLNAYEDDCEFADPAGSFRGLRRFKRNCSNFGSLLVKSNMKLTKWEDLEDKGIGHWRFSCVMSFPWRPILSATGYTEYYFDAQSMRVCRHVEHWNVPKMALLRQIFRPSRWIWDRR